MAACFCGCGRKVTGLRGRAQNAMGVELSGNLRALEGALAEGGGSIRPDLGAFVDEGREQRRLLAGLVHGEIQRKGFDKHAVIDWNSRASAMCESLSNASPGPPWEPSGPDPVDTSRVVTSGGRSDGVVLAVERSGWGNEHVASLDVSIRIDVDGEALTVTRNVQIDVTKAPRAGDQVEVAYDPSDPNRFVFRPRVDLPGGDVQQPEERGGQDRIAALRELADLHREGVLTDEEFAREKARLLGD